MIDKKNSKVKKGYSITEKECLKIGGHCYEINSMVIATCPPIYHRICKHCGKKQEGHEQDFMKWYDDDR